jgi:hypothetical protein
LVHYRSKSGILSGNTFCCKRTVFWYIGTLWKQKPNWGLLWHVSRSGWSNLADLTTVHPGTPSTSL